MGVTIVARVPTAVTFDTLNRVDRVKFLAPSHVSDLDNNGYGDLVFQNSTTGAIATVTNPSGTVNTLTGSPAPNFGARSARASSIPMPPASRRGNPASCCRTPPPVPAMAIWK